MLVESLKGTPMQPMPDIRTEFWETSIGRFRFTLEQLPSELRMVYALLTVLSIKFTLNIFKASEHR